MFHVDSEQPLVLEESQRVESLLNDEYQESSIDMLQLPNQDGWIVDSCDGSWLLMQMIRKLSVIVPAVVGEPIIIVKK